jgi:hypothetical protein
MAGCTAIFSSLPLIFIVGLSFIGKPPDDCSQYKVGKFYIYNKVNKQRVNIERRDSLQIETNSETGDIIIMKVSWRSECEYELLFNYATPKEVSKSKREQSVVEVSADIPIRVTILSGTDDYYVYEARKQGFKPSRDTVWLVKEFSSAFTK